MATLELASSSHTLVHSISCGLTSASMQRTRGLARGQPSTDLTHQDSTTTTTTTSSSNTGGVGGRNTTPRGGGGRNNSKLKVLVRSHAMREETSPPREPTPTPCINLIPSPSVSPARSASPTAAPMYNHTSPTLHSPTSPRVVLSPRCSPTTTTTNTTGSPRPQPTTPTAAGSPNHSAASPPVDGCTGGGIPVQPARGKQHVDGAKSRYADPVTVRTQDILNSAISRKINGSSASSFAQIAVELNAAVNDEHFDDDDETTMMEFSEMYGSAVANATGACDSVLNSSLNQKSPAQTVTNNINCNSGRQQQQEYIVCDCYKTTCARCTKNNNNNNNIMNSQQQQQQQPPLHSNNTLTVARANSGKHKLRHQSSSQCSFDGSSSTSPCLSRDNSTEQYTDTTGIDLTQFILETLNKNAKDRVMMLKIEQELVSLAKDKVKTHFKFPPMSSYQRMLVHRCAAYFGMDHNIEISGKCVVVNKTKSTRIPELRFRDHIREDLLFPEEPRRSILKRDSNSFEDGNYKSPDRQFDNRRSKSFEEREEEYEKARRRIFKDGTMQLQDCSSQEDFNWAEMPWPESECSKIRLLPPEQHTVKQHRLQKVQSVDGKGETTLRPCVAKSFSFGGYGGAVSVLNRGDSVTSTHSAGPRLLTKQDSSTSTISWRLSPSSSGYKSQSQRSDSVTPSPTATPHPLSSDASAKNSLDGADQQQQPQPAISEETVEQAQQTDTETPGAEGNPLVWAVTDMQSVPKGSVLIDPQTGQPFTNQDGSIYHFDPSNPPPGFASTSTTAPTPVAANPASKPPPSPPKTITPQRSPVKERSPSPKKPTKSTKVSPFKNKSCLINSSTSPSLPMTPPAHSHSSSIGYSNSSSTTLDNTQQQQQQQQQMPANLQQQYHHAAAMYPNGYGTTPGDAGGVPLYQQPLGMVYTPYAMPPPTYENRPDAAVTDLSGYFVNMALADPPPSCGTQTVGYQTPSGTYWNQQPTTITYYQQPTNPPQPQQRYPVQLPLPNQSQNTFVSSNYHPPSYGPVAANPVAASSDLLPVYPNAPMQMLYPGQQNPSTPSPMYIQNQMLYAQNPSVYPQYPPLANAAPSNATYHAPNYGVPQPSQCFAAQTPNFVHNMATGFDHHRALHRSTPKTKCAGPKQASYGAAQTQHGSNQSSNGSNSPANTIITGYFPTSANAAMNFRQCTPPDTPPNQQGLGYGYPQNYMQHSVIFRPLGGIRASPPVNMRSSRSPTPAPEYPQVGSVDRNQRYPVGPTVYHSMPCIVPGDVRLMTGRAPPPVYRQPYRQQSSCQPTADTSSAVGRAHKVRKPRTKVPALPPSGRQSNQQPVHAHTTHQQRF